MAGTRSASRKTKKTKKDDSEEEEEEDTKLQAQSKKIKKQPKKATTSPSKKKGKAKADESDEEEEDTKPKGKAKKAAAPKKEPKKKAAATKSGYTPEQKEKYNELLKDLESEKNDALKEMLRKNDQTTTGTKKELVERVADGQVLGKIPRCPKCYGGRPKFDVKTATYKCPGYRDDVDFKFCNKKYTMEELPREEWQT